MILKTPTYVLYWVLQNTLYIFGLNKIGINEIERSVFIALMAMNCGLPRKLQELWEIWWLLSSWIPLCKFI
jgi:hypothetical protein